MKKQKTKPRNGREAAILAPCQERKWEDMKEPPMKLGRIEQRCAQYREYQDDEDLVDSGPAFDFADYAANVYLPWAIEYIHELERENLKFWGKSLRWERAKKKAKK